MNHVSGSPSVETLNEMVRRIVVAVQPLMVVLFGSAAIGRMGPDSDLGLLVVMPDGVHRRQTAQKIYRILSGIGVAKDIIAMTKSDIQNYRDNPSLVIYPALREARELYHVAAK